MIPQMTVVADLTRSEDELSLKESEMVGFKRVTHFFATRARRNGRCPARKGSFPALEDLVSREAFKGQCHAAAHVREAPGAVGGAARIAGKQLLPTSATPGPQQGASRRVSAVNHRPTGGA